MARTLESCTIGEGTTFSKGDFPFHFFLPEDIYKFKAPSSTWHEHNDLSILNKRGTDLSHGFMAECWGDHEDKLGIFDGLLDIGRSKVQFSHSINRDTLDLNFFCP